MNATLSQYVDAFAKLHVNRRGGHVSPHKPAMLLAVLSLVDNGGLVENRIEYGPELLELFREYFKIVKTTSDRCTPLLPYFYLKGDKFWHHRPQSGQETVYAAMSDPGSVPQLLAVVECACLDDDLFALVANKTSREVLRNTLIERYFASHRDALLELSRQEDEIGEYRKGLEKSAPPSRVREASTEVFGDATRRTAFRRTVTSAYDYQCAACGSRVILGDLVLVDAAHLIPFSESHDDDPCNGMALCKNHHWAMDRYLIAPGPDRLWHVSRRLDDRLEGQQELLKLNRRGILLPMKRKYHPRDDSLQWRMERMKECA